MLYSQKQVLIENVQLRYPIRTVIPLKSIRYSNRTVTEQTAELESSHSVDSSARFKSPVPYKMSLNRGPFSTCAVKSYN